MNSKSMALRPAWWFALWGLLTSLSLNWVLPVFDHHAAEYSPFHSHQVVGAADAGQARQLLTEHRHGGGQAHQHTTDPVAPPPARAVIAFSVPDGALTLAARASDIVAAPAWPLTQPWPALWLVVGLAVLVAFWPTSPPLENPPRYL